MPNEMVKIAVIRVSKKKKKKRSQYILGIGKVLHHNDILTWKPNLISLLSLFE